MKYIDKNNLLDYAFVNEDTLQLPLRAICVCFHGYTDGTVFSESPPKAKSLGEKGIAWCFPYYSVWAWGSQESREFNEQVIEALYDRLHAPNDIPLIITGGSMGGMTALHYTVYGNRKACACALNCPVSDMHHYFVNNPQERRALLSAHILENGDLEEILKENSPQYFADKLPKIPYLLIYGENDKYFTDVQRPPFIEKLQQYGIDHTVWVQPAMAHCDLGSYPEAYQKYIDFIISAANAQ